MAESGWRTLTNGKKVKIDENGKVIAGFRGFMGKNISECGPIDKELRKYSRPTKQFSDYVDAKDMRNPRKAKAAAHKYFNENLRNTYVDTRVGRLGQRDIHFTGVSWGKLEMNMHKDPLKAALIEDMPSILMAKNYISTTGKTKGRDDYDKFHYFVTTVRKIDNNGVLRDVKVRIDVGERADSDKYLEVYHLSHDKKIADISPSDQAYHKQKLAPLLSEKSLTQAADNRFVEESICPFCEIVNMEILDRGGFDAPAQDSMPNSADMVFLTKCLRKVRYGKR